MRLRHLYLTGCNVESADQSHALGKFRNKDLCTRLPYFGGKPNCQIFTEISNWNRTYLLQETIKQRCTFLSVLP